MNYLSRSILPKQNLRKIPTQVSYTVSVLTKQGLGFLGNLLLAKFVSAEVYADYASYINIGTYLLLTANFGFSEYSLIQSTKRPYPIERYILFFLGVALLIFALIASIGVVLGAGLLFVLVAGKIFVETIVAEILLPWYQKYNQFGKLTQFNFIYSVTFTFLIGALWSGLISIEGFLFGSIITSLVLILFQVFPIYRDAATKHSAFFPPIDRDIIYYGINYVTVPMYMRLVPLLTVLMLDDHSIAEFHLGFTIASACIIVALSQIKVILPALINATDIFPILIRNVKILTIINFAILVTFILTGRFFIDLIYAGKNFTSLYPLVIGLLAANLLQTISGVLATALTARNFQKSKLSLQIEIIIVSLILGIPLIYFFGIAGAIATILITYTYVIFRSISVMRKLGILHF